MTTPERDVCLICLREVWLVPDPVKPGANMWTHLGPTGDEHPPQVRRD